MTGDSILEYPLENRPAIPHWCENFALMVSDPVNRLSVFFNLGTWYADTSVWREVFGVFFENGLSYVARNYGRNTRSPVVSASLAQYHVLEPEARFRLVYHGPVWEYARSELMTRGAYGRSSKLLKLDLTFSATAPIWNMAVDGDDQTSMSGALHTEQLGTSSGCIQIEESEQRILDAPSVRDHTRGVRRGERYKNHCWIQGAFANGRAFHLYSIALHDVADVAMAHATVIEDNRHYPAKIKQCEFLKSAAHAREGQTILLDSDLGEMRVDVDRVLTSLPLSFVAPWDLHVGALAGVGHGSIFDGMARMSWNGCSSVGWYERGFMSTPLPSTSNERGG